ncbi:MAG TPA: aminoacetone oxidase family FAD-binding enzyme [Verrucomicrobia bacterium]|nr:aminoacetone oxidase family FAD-binding enzyme [Verrucomicrobiota bacterium]
MQTPDLVVIGAGAAGLLAAGTAAAGGARVVLLEKMPKPGCKLAITGKGRCNLTNIEPRGSFESHFGAMGVWLRPAFDAYFAETLIAFLESEGLPVVTERGGRVFPANGRAPDVVNLLVAWCRCQGVKIELRQPVRRLLAGAGGGIEGVETESKTLACRNVVLATGGASYPGTGSTGDGYALAATVGHAIVPPRPALVPLECSPKPARDLDGLGLKNVGVALRVNGREVGSGFGEMGFTAHGVNGPVVLTLSGLAVEALAVEADVRLGIDLKPALSMAKLQARLERDLAERANEPIRSVLRGLLPKAMVASFLATVGIPGMQLGGRLAREQRSRIVQGLKDMEIRISGHRGMTEAIVTAGGVALDEVDEASMASRRVTGLYFAGEILDLHADTGGYNLQAAFSTGVLAARSVLGRMKGLDERYA